MNESNSIKAIDKTNLSEQTKFRLSEIIGIENYFHQEINQRKSCSKICSCFDYIDKVLNVLSATSREVSIISFTNIVGAPVGMASASFTIILSLTTRIVKTLLNIKETKIRNMIKLLCWLKLNSIVLKL